MATHRDRMHAIKKNEMDEADLDDYSYEDEEWDNASDGWDHGTQLREFFRFDSEHDYSGLDLRD